jgi:hypothetical protein
MNPRHERVLTGSLLSSTAVLAASYAASLVFGPHWLIGIEFGLALGVILAAVCWLAWALAQTHYGTHFVVSLALLVIAFLMFKPH